jgi:hypothetical protein
MLLLAAGTRIPEAAIQVMRDIEAHSPDFTDIGA